MTGNRTTEKTVGQCTTPSPCCLWRGRNRSLRLVGTDTGTLLGRRAGAAGAGILFKLPHREDEPRHSTSLFLGLCCPRGPVTCRPLPCLHRREYRSHFLHNGGNILSHEPLRLHDANGSFPFGFVPIDGAVWRHHRKLGKRVYGVVSVAIRDLCDRGYRICGADRIRHAANQEHPPGERQFRYRRKKRPSWVH